MIVTIILALLYHSCNTSEIQKVITVVSQIDHKSTLV